MGFGYSVIVGSFWCLGLVFGLIFCLGVRLWCCVFGCMVVLFYFYGCFKLFARFCCL